MPYNRPKIHYAGEVHTRKGTRPAGGAACTSGPKAKAIAERGWNTTEVDKVTCLWCRQIIGIHNKLRARLIASGESPEELDTIGMREIT